MTEPVPDRDPVHPGLISYRIGGRSYPARLHGACLVCRSAYRAEIERGIAEGQHFSTVADALPDEAHISAASVRNHFVGNHMPLKMLAIRRIYEDRQNELGANIEAGVAPIADQVALARTVVNRAFTRIASGEVEPTVAEGIAAAKLLQQLGVDDNGTDKSAYTEAFLQYMQAAQEQMSEEQFTGFLTSLQQNPVLNALVRRAQGQQGIAAQSDPALG